jgi:general secretion pathway protein F
MTTFAFRGFDRSGRAADGLVDAPDPKSARDQLAARGILAERVDPAGAAAAGGRFRGRSPLAGPAGRAVFYQELAALLRAGMPLAQALGLLIESPDWRAAQRALAAVRDRIREGAGLAAALAACLPALQPFEAPMLEAGERSATLDDALERLARFLDEQARLREQALTALVYPAFVLALALAIAVGALGFAFPRIVRILQEGRAAALPPLTRAVMAAGRVVGLLAPPALVALGAGLAWFRVRARTDSGLRLRWDRRLFRCPVLGRGRALLAAVRFSRTLALLLRGGAPLVEAVPIAGRATGSPWLAAETAETARAVEHGESLARALRRVPALADELSHWIEVGEAAGALDNVLDQAGDRLQQQWRRRSTRLLALLEPALILAVGAFVFILVLAILLPILALNAGPR